MKKVFAFLFMLFLSVSCYADSSPKQCTEPECGQATIGSATFCTDFTDQAHCFCRKNFPTKPGWCNGLTAHQLYDMMIAATKPPKTQERACANQHNVPYEICMQHWDYFKSHCPF